MVCFLTKGLRVNTDNDARVAAPGIRQTMSSLHTWAGLLLGWVLYAMFLTGTVSYFKDELSQWMRPELPRLSQIPDQTAVAQRLADELGNLAPGTSQWSIRLPDERNNSVYAFWRTTPRNPGQRGFGEGNFDPATGQRVTSRDTLGGEFFFRFHFQFHYMPVVWGRWLAGAAAMFMLVAIVSGVITHKKIFVDFFTFRWGKRQRSWLDAHNSLSVFGLPFHFMITYTGLVTLMALYMPWGEQVAFKTPAERQQLSAELSAFIQPGKASGQKLPLASLEDMVRQAQERWGRDNVGRVTVVHPGDAAARVSVARGEAGRVSMSPQYMEFDGATGKLLTVRECGGCGRNPGCALCAPPRALQRHRNAMAVLSRQLHGYGHGGHRLGDVDRKAATEAARSRSPLLRLPPCRAIEHREHRRLVDRHDRIHVDQPAVATSVGRPR